MYLNFDDVKVNNRIQIESENDDPTKRNVQGIVLAIDRDKIVLVTNFGKLAEVHENQILSLTRINFDKIVSDSLFELKNHYTEIYELESKLEKIREQEPLLVESLYDSNFLAKFNIRGAKIRLDSSVDSDLMVFEKDMLSFHISFESNPDNQIEILIKVYNSFEYYNLDEIGEVDKIIRVHAPNVKDVIEKSFSFKSKTEELEKKVAHDKDSLYNVSTRYRIKVDVTQENFLEVREEIRKGLSKLKR